MKIYTLLLTILTLMLVQSTNCQWRTEYNVKDRGYYTFEGTSSIINTSTTENKDISGRLDISTFYDVDTETYTARIDILKLDDDSLFSSGFYFTIEDINVDSGAVSETGKYYTFDNNYYKYTTDDDLKSEDSYSFVFSSTASSDDRLEKFTNGFTITNLGLNKEIAVITINDIKVRPKLNLTYWFMVSVIAEFVLSVFLCIFWSDKSNIPLATLIISSMVNAYLFYYGSVQNSSEYFLLIFAPALTAITSSIAAARKGCFKPWKNRAGSWFFGLITLAAAGISHFMYPEATHFAIFAGLFVVLTYETINSSKIRKAGFFVMLILISKAQLTFNVLYFRDYIVGIYFGIMIGTLTTVSFLLFCCLGGGESNEKKKTKQERRYETTVKE